MSAESLLVIINDILDFSKIEAGKMDIEESELDVPGVVDDVGRILAGTAHGKGIELLVDVHPDVPSALLGDGTRIRQVLLNFGANAVKFTSEGEVVIRVKVLHQSAERVALHFDVVDTGIGIAAEDQERLFSAFAQADSSTTRRYGGTGLGLTISRQLVELMGGRLGLTSVAGRGIDVLVRAVASSRGRCAGARQGAGDPRTLSGQRALVVDDNATNRRILRQQLLSWGVEAVEAADGFEALELALTAAEDGRAFDLGVVDLNMPGMDGIELARALKADPLDGGDDALLAELVRPPPRAGGVPPDRLRRQPDQAGAVVGAVRLPDHQPQLGVGIRDSRGRDDRSHPEPARASWARSCSSRTTR